MYEKFYGLREKPFQIMPNPSYLYISPVHQNALTYLEYGLMENVGIILLSGGPVARGLNLTPQKLEGVAPTLLYLLGEPVPADMDGGVFVSALRPDCLQAHEIRFAEPVPWTRKDTPGVRQLEERRKTLESVPYLR